MKNVVPLKSEGSSVKKGIAIGILSFIAVAIAILFVTALFVPIPVPAP